MKKGYIAAIVNGNDRPHSITFLIRNTKDGAIVTNIKKDAHVFSDHKSAHLAAKEIGAHLGINSGVAKGIHLVVAKSTDTKKHILDFMSGTMPKANPIKGSKKRRIAQAGKLFESFTGHEADYYDEVSTPDYDTCLTIGECTGIMYETTRDGKKERYLHEFKKASQPALCVSFDGQQIFLIGGSYLFKDSGINDV